MRKLRCPHAETGLMPGVQRRSASSPTKRPTSVTMPSAWWLPRSVELGHDRLVDVDAVGLDPGREKVAGRDRVQVEASIERDVDTVHEVPHGVGGGEGVAQHVGQRPVVAHRATEHEGDSGADAFVEDTRSEPAGLDGGGDGAVSPDLVDHPQMVGVPVLGGDALAERDPERCAEHRGLDVVGGEAVAGEEDVDPAFSDHPGESRCGAGVHDRRPADGEDPAPRASRAPDRAQRVRA